jgi:hypothetical protein
VRNFICLLFIFCGSESFAQIRENFRGIENYRLPFPYEEVLSNPRNINESELGLLISRLTYELNLLPESGAVYQVDDLKHIDLMIQMISGKAITKGYYSNVIFLDNLASRKLYSHPLYSSLWAYQFTRMYFLARRELDMDERTREGVNNLIRLTGDYIKAYMQQDTRPTSRSYSASFNHYGEGAELLRAARTFMSELMTYQVDPKSGLFVRPTNLVVPQFDFLMVSSDGVIPEKPKPQYVRDREKLKANARGEAQPVVAANPPTPTSADACNILFDPNKAIYMPEFTSSKRH